MIPLEDLINRANLVTKERNPALFVHVFQRCSGLFGSFYNELYNDQDDEMLKQAAYYLEA